MTQKQFNVSGMKCVNCKANVERAINALAGVDEAVANLDEGNVTVCYDETVVTPQAMKEAVEDLGRFEMDI